MVERLRLGLGRMVRQVASYAGEFDEGLSQVIRQFPAAWVTFAGVMSTRSQSTSRVRYTARGRFVVMVGARSVQSAAARRDARLPGTYLLQHAVRRLLANQDLGLDGVDALQPGAVRTLFNGAIQSQGFSVFACEFDTAWREEPLPAGRFAAPGVDPAKASPDNPSGVDPQDPDAVFAEFEAKLDAPYPDLTGVRLDYRAPPKENTDAPDASDLVKLQP